MLLLNIESCLCLYFRCNLHKWIQGDPLWSFPILVTLSKCFFFFYSIQLVSRQAPILGILCALSWTLNGNSWRPWEGKKIFSHSLPHWGSVEHWWNVMKTNTPSSHRAIYRCVLYPITALEVATALYHVEQSIIHWEITHQKCNTVTEMKLQRHLWVSVCMRVLRGMEDICAPFDMFHKENSNAAQRDGHLKCVQRAMIDWLVLSPYLCESDSCHTRRHSECIYWKRQHFNQQYCFINYFIGNTLFYKCNQSLL